MWPKHTRQHGMISRDEQPSQLTGKAMAYLLGLPVGANGNEVLVFEVDPSEVSDDLVLAAPPEPGQIVAKAQVTLEQALAKLKPSLQKIMHTLKELSPDETEVEFGLKIGGETGVIIAKGTAEVNFTVRMSWKNQ
jgi:Trypsin-co-occurring domain 1